MKLYTEPIRPGNYSNINFYTAQEAYYSMGFEIVTVENLQEIEIGEDHMFLGSIKFIHSALEKLGKHVPEPLDYPNALTGFLGRKIWESTINEIARDQGKWNVFVKPKGFLKKFTGRYISSAKDLQGCGDAAMNTPVWVSEPVDFIAEWRVFVRYGTILGVKAYRGPWSAQFDHRVIEQVVAAYTDAPAGYALDFGLTKYGELLLVEANDGFSLGNYGLFCVDYAKLLSARWAEMTGTTDLCAF